MYEQNNSLPFNKYAFLTTHNAFAIEGEPSHTGVPRITVTNQEDTITQQLNVCYSNYKYITWLKYHEFSIFFFGSL